MPKSEDLVPLEVSAFAIDDEEPLLKQPSSSKQESSGNENKDMKEMTTTNESDEV